MSILAKTSATKLQSKSAFQESRSPSFSCQLHHIQSQGLSKAVIYASNLLDVSVCCQVQDSDNSVLWEGEGSLCPQGAYYLAGFHCTPKPGEKQPATAEPYEEGTAGVTASKLIFSTCTK